MAIAVLDVGGTAIKSSLWENGKLSEVQETPTPFANAHILTCGMIEIIRKMGPVQAVGISTRGQVDGEGRILFDNGPIHDYSGTHVKAILENALGVPVCVENDVNCAALAEGKLGAGIGHEEFLCVTFGTGIGGAIIRDGKLYHGSNWSAGEFGAMQLFSQSPSGDGLCAAFYENLASATALVDAARAVDPSIQNGRQVCDRLEDPLIAPAVRRWVRNVSYGLSSLIHIFNPSLIVLGGGILQNKTLFRDIDSCTHSQLMPGFENVCLKPALLGNNAGMMGAGLLASQQ